MHLDQAVKVLKQMLEENSDTSSTSSSFEGVLNKTRTRAVSKAIEAMEFLDILGRTQTPTTKEEALAEIRELIAKLQKVEVETEKIDVQ